MTFRYIDKDFQKAGLSPAGGDWGWFTGFSFIFYKEINRFK